MKVLLVEDNRLLGKSLKRGLEEAGWTVDLAADGEEGLYLAEAGAPDVIVLDWMLPKRSGIDVLKDLRARKVMTPTIMITAKGAVPDRVAGLNDGADDYLVKPFELVELIARITALHRRAKNNGAAVVTLGDLEVHLSGHSARLKGAPLDLTSKEFDLLSALAARSSELVSRAALVGILYNVESEPDSNSLDVLLARIRKKLGGANVEIATIRGKGFMLRVAEPSP